MIYKGSDARFYEYGSTGSGSHDTESRRHLTDEQMVRYYSIKKVLDGWDPIYEN